MNEYNVSEDAETVSVCIDSGVTEGFQTDLTVTIFASDGAACKYFDSDILNTMFFDLLYLLIVVKGDTDLVDDMVSLVFPAGSSSSTLCASIPITNDTLLEGNQNFSLTVIDVGPYAIINNMSLTTVIIIDNDCKQCKYTKYLDF